MPDSNVVPIKAPSRDELWSRICLARSVLSHRTPSRDTVALVLQVLAGTEIDDLVPPPAVARLDGKYLVVSNCPHCHRQHHHGAGDPDRPAYGPRVAHCSDGRGLSYVLTPEGG